MAAVTRRRPIEGQQQLELFTQAPEPPAGLAAAATSPPPPPRSSASAPIPSRTPKQLSHLHTTAHHLAEKIARVWYGHGYHTGDSIVIPLGTTAALAMLGRRHVRDGTDVPQHVLALNPEQLQQFLREVWAHAWLYELYDPYLTSCSHDLWGWLDDRDTSPPADVLAAVHSVTHAAVKGGLFDLTGDPDPVWRCQHDVLGALLTELRSPGARDARAEHHSPPDMAHLLIRMAC